MTESLFQFRPTMGEEESVEGAGAAVDGARSAQATRPTALFDALPRVVRDQDFVLYGGDASDILGKLPKGSVDCCVTSPPYWGLRDYAIRGQLGLETRQQYIDRLCSTLDRVAVVLKESGTLWLNLGDCWVEKQLQMVPARVALELQRRGWILRSEIIWHKPNAVPESVTDRPSRAHEVVYLFARTDYYRYFADAVREPHAEKWQHTHYKYMKGNVDHYKGGERKSPGMHGGFHPLGRNKRTVWDIPTKPSREDHPAMFPEALAEVCILAGTLPGDVVIDPFIGSGTTALVARRLGRRSVGIEMNPDYAALCARRLAQQSLLGEDVA